MKKFILPLLAAAFAIPVFADEIEDAVELINNGQLQEARELLTSIESSNPHANLYLGRIDFLEYDFPEAARRYGLVNAALKAGEEYQLFNRQLQTGKQMIGHVEKIVVIDSLTVDKENFFKTYRLSPASGRILNAREVKELKPEAESSSSGFTNEFENYLLWSAPDANNATRLYESVLMTDGKWSEPVPLPGILNNGTAVEEPEEDEAEDGEEREPVKLFDAAYPFMLDDGQTLYYASNNQNSLGGYDIFMATKDVEDGTFLQPRNIGMPFNSPADDYLLAIDPLTGAGWWASDRNHIPDKLTIYVYIVPESRQNVESDDENVLTLARVGDVMLTQTDAEEKIAEVRKAISDVKPSNRGKKDFYLPMGAKTYTVYADFKNKDAAEKMRTYMAESATFEKESKELQALRDSYTGNGKTAAARQQIEKLEKKLRQDSARLRRTLSDVYRLERGRNR